MQAPPDRSKSQLDAGQGFIRLERNGPKATLSELAFCYPLKLMPPRISAGDASLGLALICLYMLTYGAPDHSIPLLLYASCLRQLMRAVCVGAGGGLVSGDTVDLKITIEADAHLVLLTQGNTKVFRERSGGAYTSVLAAGEAQPATRQRLCVEIASGASLFLMPAPVTCFEGAAYSQRQSFHLADAQTSSLLLLDWFTSGRLARGESWAFERYRSSNEIFVAGKRIANDVLLLEQKPRGAVGTEQKSRGGIAARMGPYACYCTLLIVGKPLAALLAQFQRLAHATQQYRRTEPESLVWSFSELEQGTEMACGIVRCAGVETETVREWLAHHLEPLMPIVGSDIYRAAFV